MLRAQLFQLRKPCLRVNAVNPEIYAVFFSGKTHCLSPLPLMTGKATGANHGAVPQSLTKSLYFLHYPMFNVLCKLFTTSNFARKGLELW